jgi:hypothetical protein
MKDGRATIADHLGCVARRAGAGGHRRIMHVLIKAASAHNRTGPITTFRSSVRTRALSMRALLAKSVPGSTAPETATGVRAGCQ